MTIETKYNLKDTVWFLGSGGVECRQIWNIKVTVHDGKSYIDYVFFEQRGHNNHKEMQEKFCFPTKEALLQSL